MAKKQIRKLRKAVEELRERNEDLVEEVEKLREAQEESHEEITALLAGLREGEGPREDEPDAPTVSADDEISTGGDEESAEEEANTPTVAADDEIVADGREGESAARKPQATESAKKKARELGVDLSGIEGTGSRGRITVADVERAAG